MRPRQQDCLLFNLAETLHYFYSDDELTVDKFRLISPNGSITEWFPQAVQIVYILSFDRPAYVPNKRGIAGKHDSLVQHTSFPPNQPEPTG